MARETAPGSPAPIINFALIRFPSYHIGCPDKSLSSDLTAGIPLVGSISESSVSRKRRMGATITQSVWREGLFRRNLDMPERVRKSDGADLEMLRWEKALNEVERGWVARPIPVTSDALKPIPLPP